MSESPYYIAELKAGEKGGFAPRGAVKALWQSRDFETIVSGPAETGKTWGCLQYADALLWKYPGAQGVICRKKYTYLIGSAVRTYLRILGPDSPVRAFGGEKPQWFDYPNGSRMWIAGLDNPGKALSSERDFIYVNQAEELSIEDWETLTTRATGRGSVMPYTRMFGDCNPGNPRHWIKAREKAGKLKLLESRHRDNPSLYTDAFELTPQGERTMGILDGLTGARRLRLRDGKWASNEGLVYETFDAAIHVIPSSKFNRASIRRYVAGVDWGYTEPGAIEVFGVDGDGRMYRVAEVYYSRKLIGWWVEQAKRLASLYPIDTFSCDPAEPAYIEAFRSADLPAEPAFNDIAPGVQAVQNRLTVQEDGRARLYFVDGSDSEVDEVLTDAKKPSGMREEMDSYAWPKTPDGKPNKEIPEDKDNHGCDAGRYAVTLVDDTGAETASLDSGFYHLTPSN